MLCKSNTKLEINNIIVKSSSKYLLFIFVNDYVLLIDEIGEYL